MRRALCLVGTACLLFSAGIELSGQTVAVRQGNVVYDFTFAGLAVKYLESGDPALLPEIAGTDAARHIFNHAVYSGSSVPHSTALEMVTFLLSPVSEKRMLLPGFKKNLEYALDSIAGTNTVREECLKYLPGNFNFSPCAHLYFTFGYDLGVVFAGNASVNLAHPHYLENEREILFYAIHELHHAGFVMLKDNFMPSLEIRTYGEMARLIAYFTELEGMAVYAASALREKEHALGDDPDYAALADPDLMARCESEYFRIYNRFRENPDSLLSEEDWDLISPMSGGDRLWYRVGALMAGKIDDRLGRERLVGFISGPPENFIYTYSGF